MIRLRHNWLYIRPWLSHTTNSLPDCHCLDYCGAVFVAMTILILGPTFEILSTQTNQRNMHSLIAQHLEAMHEGKLGKTRSSEELTKVVP
jgi:hypothetical protein